MNLETLITDPAIIRVLKPYGTKVQAKALGLVDEFLKSIDAGDNKRTDELQDEMCFGTFGAEGQLVRSLMDCLLGER